MKRILFFLFILQTLTAPAQFNDTTNYHLKYSATGIFNKTNDGRSYVLNNFLGFNIKKRRVSFNSSNSWIYGRQDENLTNNDFSSAFNFDLLKDLQKLYYWGLANYTTSYSLKINYQYQAGAGLGYNIVNREDLELVVSDGILFEASDLELDPIGRDVYQTFRNSFRIKHRWVIGNLVSLEGSHFWQPSLKAFKDYIIRSSGSLSLKLKKWLSITTAVTYNRLSRTDRENLLINFGLTADTYF